jgi:hypothetical protein
MFHQKVSSVSERTITNKFFVDTVSPEQLERVMRLYQEPLPIYPWTLFWLIL